MKFVKKLALSFIILFLLNNTSSFAKILENPVGTVKSEKWEVKLKRLEDEPNLPYKSFSLFIKNKGENASKVRVEVYKKEENDNKEYSLMTFDSSDTRDLVMNNEVHRLQNLSVSNNATEIKVEVVWLEDNRPVKEIFTFK